MKTTAEQRLSTLHSEYEAGRKMMAELDEKRATLSQTLLRIEGAIQVLKELLASEGAGPPPAGEPGSR
jgi:hypothetical protein